VRPPRRRNHNAAYFMAKTDKLDAYADDLEKAADAGDQSAQ
jgi:hypothetical protein